MLNEPLKDNKDYLDNKREIVIQFNNLGKGVEIIVLVSKQTQKLKTN